MTSPLKVKANRENAQASTGPRTAYGRACAGQNARRHGLSLSVVSVPALSQQAEALARQIADGSPNATIVELARRVAEAHVDLLRIRQARHDLFMRSVPDTGGNDAADVTKQLVALDRYERRALSRRKFAVREFDSERRHR
jgi:enoyl-CoA hydratase/carnithine racemase